MSRVIKLKDIAEKTGFTINTVSRALKNKDDISETTKLIIKNTAREMGYIGNQIAGSLRSGYSKTVAVILGDISNPYFSIITKEIERKISEYGYRILILNTEEDNTLEEEAIQSSLCNKVDGIIISPCQKTSKNIELLKKSGTPFVLLGRHFADDDMNFVICDDVNGGYIATQHLINLGHKKILFLNGPMFLSPAIERFMGYRCALQQYNIQFKHQLVHEVPIIPDENKILDMLRKNLDFTAVLAFSDLIAFQTICVLEKLGRIVPQDISIVGFDNILSNLGFPCSLTSVDTSKVEIAHNAVSVLLNQINGNEKFSNTTISNNLIVRASTHKNNL